MKWFSAIATELNFDCGFTKCERQTRLQEFNSDLHYAPKLLVAGLCPECTGNWKSSACFPKQFAGRGRRFIKDREWGDENGKGKGWGWVLGVELLHAVRGTDAAVLPCEQSGLECDNLFTLPLFSPSHSVHSWSLKSFHRLNACRVSILATVFRCATYSEYRRW